jgi:hypothetical protein
VYIRTTDTHLLDLYQGITRWWSGSIDFLYAEFPARFKDNTLHLYSPSFALYSPPVPAETCGDSSRKDRREIYYFHLPLSGRQMKNNQPPAGNDYQMTMHMYRCQKTINNENITK